MPLLHGGIRTAVYVYRLSVSLNELGPKAADKRRRWRGYRRVVIVVVVVAVVVAVPGSDTAFYKHRAHTRSGQRADRSGPPRPGISPPADTGLLPTAAELSRTRPEGNGTANEGRGECARAAAAAAGPYAHKTTDDRRDGRVKKCTKKEKSRVWNKKNREIRKKQKRD